MLLTFFERYDISWMCPGIKDYITVRLDNGVKVKRQKRILIFNLKEVLVIFSEKYEHLFM